MILNIAGLKVACFLDWFVTPFGAFSLFASLVLAAFSQVFPWDDEELKEMGE